MRGGEVGVGVGLGKGWGAEGGACEWQRWWVQHGPEQGLAW
jgi:hypothetical protein